MRYVAVRPALLVIAVAGCPSSVTIPPEGDDSGGSEGATTGTTSAGAGSMKTSSGVGANGHGGSDAPGGGGASGTGGGAVEAGCADGTREGFLGAAAFPNIAGCSGAWSVPGVVSTFQPQCGLGAGNDGPNPTGDGCSVADLCQAGWEVCVSAAAVAASSPTGCAGATPPDPEPLIFITRQSGPGNWECSDNATNDLYGCGNISAGTPQPSCGPLDSAIAVLAEEYPTCNSPLFSPPWSCGWDNIGEALAITKSDSTYGGVLCCRQP